METPWGRAHTYTIAPGIISCSTPSHGGFYVSEERFNAMPPEYQALAFPGRSRNNGAWFEEDSAWVAVVLSFPDEFLAYHTKQLHSWEHAPTAPDAYPTNLIYYQQDGHFYSKEQRDDNIAYHQKQLQELIVRAQAIYQTWYVNRNKEQS